MRRYTATTSSFLRSSLFAFLTAMLLLAAAPVQQAAAQDGGCTICENGSKPKVSSLEFLFKASSDTPDPAYIVVVDKEHAVTLFEGTVADGETFTAYGNGVDDSVKFPENDIKILIFDPNDVPSDFSDKKQFNEDQVGVIKVHVSCSKPLFFGMDPAAQEEDKQDKNAEDIGILSIVGGTDTNGYSIQENGPCTTPDPDPETDCAICVNDAKVTSITLLYSGDTEQFILVQDKDNNYTYFAGMVQPGEQFVANGTDTDGEFHKNDLEIIVLSSDPGAPYETDYDPQDEGVIIIHVSCSKPIFYGLDPALQEGKEDDNPEDVGLFTLTGGLDSSGDSICDPNSGGDEECKLEGSLLGQEGATIVVEGITVTFTDWVLKSGETNEWVGFTIDVPGLNFVVKAGTSQFEVNGETTWLHPNGLSALAISNIDFCVPQDFIDLELDKAFEGPENGEITYTLTLFNNGDNATSEATNVEIEDVLPAGATFVSATPDAYDANTNIWTVDALAAGATASLEIIASVGEGSLDNCAQVSDADQYDVDSTPGNGFDNGEDDFSCVEVPVIDLELDKSFSGPANGQITYTIDVSNNDNNATVDATGVTVSDVLPAGATFVSFAPASAGVNYNVNTREITWTIGTLAKGASVSLDIVANVGTGSLDNCAEVMTANEYDIDSTPGDGSKDQDDDDCVTVPNQPNPVIDLELDKSFSGPTNGQITYTIDVVNNGDNATVDATGVSVKDILPAGATFVSATSSDYNNATGVWTIGALAKGATVSLDIVASVSDPYDLNNCAEVMTAGENDVDSTPNNGFGNNEDDKACVTVPNPPPAECKIEGDLIGVEGAQVDVNGTIVTFTNWVAKDGNPNEFIGFDIDVDGLTFWVKAGTEVYEVTGTSWINPNGTGGSDVKAISNVDFRCDGGGDDPVIDLELDKSFSGPANGQITYTIDVFNNDDNATVDATNVTVKDVLPAGASFVSASSGDYNSATGIWTIGTLAKGATVSLDIVANVTDANDLDNCAEVMTAGQNDYDSTPGDGSTNQDDDDCVTVPGNDPKVDIEVQKTASTLSPEFGESFTYTITVTNKGPADASNLEITEDLPAGVTYVSHTTSAGTWSNGTGLWLLSSLPAGDSETLVITVQVNGASGSLTDGQYVLHNHPGNDLAPPGFGLRLDELFGGLKGITFDFDHPDSYVVMTVDGDDVVIDGVVYGGHDKGASYDPATEGLWDVHFEYNNVVSSVPGDDDLYVNDSDSEVSTGTIIPRYNTAWFSAGDVFDLQDKSDGSYSFRLGDENNDLGYNGYNGISGWGWLMHGQNGNLEHAPISDWLFTAVPVTSMIENCAELTSLTETDSDSVPADGKGDDYACITITPGEPVVDLGLEKSVDQTDAATGDIITYTLTVSNDAAAGATATNVVAEDVLPSGVQFLESNPASNVTFDAGSNTLSWLITSLAPGASVQLDIEVRVLSGPQLHNCAEIVSADQNDVDDVYGDGTGEDFDCATTTTNDPFIDLYVDKAAYPTNPGLGDVVDYTITVRNDASATQTAFGVQVVDNVPAGMSIQSTNPSSNVSVNSNSNVVSWLIPSLAPGAEVVLHIYAQVNEPGNWVNCAEIMRATGTTSNTFGDGQGQDIDCVTTSTPDPTIDLSLVKTVDNATPALGAEITYTLTVTNSSNATETATGVVVEDQLPAGVTLDPGFSAAGVTVSPSGLITWNVGSVAKGAVAMLDIPVTVSVSAIQQNCAEITAADQDDVDSTPDNGVGTGEDDSSCVTITPNLNPPNLMCYVLADNEDHTGSADVLTYINGDGQEVSIGLTGSNDINAIEYVGANGKLYAVDGNTFGTLNAGNGLFSPIGSLGSGQGALGGQTFDSVSGMALDPFTGILYATVRKAGADLLIQINLLNGQAVTNAFGPAKTYVVIPAVSGADEVDDIAIHPTTGVMYGVVNGGGISRLITIDKATGASALVTNINVASVRGLAFRENGQLLGTLGSVTNEVRRINLSTGSTTLVSNLGINGNFDYEAITCNTNAPNTLSGTVYLDNNEDAMFNGGDVGQAGVTVELWKDNNSDGVINGNDIPVGTLVTDANGFYAFNVLTSGYFVVQTDLGTYPAGASLTTDNVETAYFPGYGDSDTGNDFGYKLEPVVLGSIGDEVFADDNGNGVRDSGEAGLTGILLRLYSGACPVSGTPLATRVSNASGGYNFTMLPAGTYCVDVDNATVPSGYALTTANDPMTVVLGNGQDFDLADFGFYFDPQAVEADLELTKEVDTSSPSLDDVVEFTITVTNNGPADATGLIVRDLIPVGLVFQDYSSSKGTYEANKLGYWTIGELPVGHTETLKIRTKVVITNMIENIAQVSHVDQEDPDSFPGNGVPSEDDQDNAIVESRGPGSVGDIIAVECADLGTVNALQYSTFDGQIYSGTEVGTVHISNDDGQNWPAFLNTDGEAPVRDIVLDSNGAVYAGSFGSGVYRSTNSGDNWTNIGPVGGSINDLDVDNGTNTVYAAAHGEVIRLVGMSWQTVGASSNPFDGDQVLAVVYQENNNTVLATSAASGTWLFDGSTWTNADDGLPTGKVNVLFRSPDGIILAGHNNRGVFMWGGSGWYQLGMGLDNEPIESIGSGPNGEVLAGSRETGAYFLNKITGEWLSIGNLPVFTVSAMTGGPTGEVYAGAPGEGIYVIYDQDFDGIPDVAHQVSNFMTSAIIQDLVVAPNGDMWAATYGYGILYSKDGGNCWTRMNRGLDNLWTFAIDRTSDGTLFIGIWADGLGGIWRSTDDGRNWEFLAYGTRQIISLAVDPINEDIVYAGANIAGEGALFRSMDGGDTWSDVGNFIYPVWSITIDPTDNNHVYVGTMGAGIYESFDQGLTFEQIGSPSNGLDNPYVFDMVYAPVGTPYAGQLFAATDAGVYRYDTFAETWTLFGEYSEDFQFRTIAFSGNEIYGGTWNAGVVQYNALTNEWADYGLSDMPVVAFAVHQQTETLVIGTSGSGVFLAPNLRMSTDTEEVIGSEIPTTFALDQNYPNPFNPQTSIPFDLRETTRVKMAVYDMLGREVGMLVDGTLQAGQHQVTWDAGDVPSGTYLVRMEAAGQTFTRTMILLK